MCSAESLREFVSERLTAAAEEIFSEFVKTIVQYEEEIDRQRRLLGISSNPQTHSHTTDLPLQHVCKEEVLNQEEPEPPRIKEEPEELCTSHGGEQIVVKQESDTFMVTPTYEEHDCGEPGPNSEQRLHHKPPVSESQDQGGRTLMMVQCNPNNEEVARAQTVIQYKEETDHQRGALDITSTPRMKLHRKDLPQQHVCKEEEVLADQQLCDQERSSSLDQEEPEPPQMKEEQEELCTSQEGEHLGLKQETDTLMVTPAKEENESREPEPNSQQVLSPISPESESQDQGGSEREDSAGPSRKSVECDVCGKAFRYKSEMKKHSRIHTGVKPHACTTCGKRFYEISLMKIHQRIHTDEKPFCCEICGKGLRSSKGLLVHVRSHTGEKPYLCKDCGNRFSDLSVLRRHMAIHTGEKRHFCTTCGKRFRYSNHLLVHIRTHTGEKPYPCNTCGKRFIRLSLLKKHTRTHTGERPFACDTCGKRFKQSYTLKCHIRCHTGEKPYTCDTCGQTFSRSSMLKKHMRTHTATRL